MEDLTTRVDPSSDGGDPDERGVRLPARIGRYEVLARLGQGGMGVVCTAYDDRLERKVAIKLLSRGPRGGTDDSTRVSRLEREAQALAQISHPNVLQVFEVGRHEAQVYIVLEYVKGSTLGDWCRAAPRSWRAVLEKYLQAGEGLQAAHAVGIVHRDFKPDNALVDAAGRVRVMDFGLARVGLAPEPASGRGEAATAQTSERSSPTLELSLTSPGAVLGTPAYMAPEQFRGEDVDARTDVYCFCVALWEALFGARPFRGRDLAELRADVLSGRAPTARAGRRVPAWLRRAVARGLALAPADRWPTMAALLQALRADPSLRRRRALVAATVAGALAAGAWGWTRRAAREVEACAEGSRRSAAVWGEAQAEALRRAFAATGRPHAAATADGVVARLDARGAAWAATYVDACEGHLRGEQSAELLDRRMACLDRRLAEVAALVERFAEVDAEMVDRAVAATDELDPVAACADVEALQARVPPPEAPEVRAAVDAVRGRLDRVEATARAGAHRLALASIEPQIAASEALPYPPLQAEALFLHATILRALGRAEAAEAQLFRAVAAAEAGRHDELAAKAWALLTVVTGAGLGQYQQSQRWAALAAGAVTRAGDPPHLRIALLRGRGATAFHHKRHAEALADYEAAYALQREVLGEDHLGLASARNDLGNACSQLGRLPEALAHHEAALALRLRLLGPDHPDVAASYNNLGVTLQKLGELDRAGAAFERARATWFANGGEDEPHLAHVMVNLANLAVARGDYAETERLLRRGLEHARKLPPEGFVAAALRNNLGAIYTFRGEFSQAEALLSASLAHVEATDGVDSPNLTSLLGNLATVASLRGDHPRAEALERRRLEVARKRDAEAELDATGGLAMALLELGRVAEAAPLARRARELYDARPGPERDPLPLTVEATLALRQRRLDVALARVREVEAELSRKPAQPHIAANFQFLAAQVLWDARADRPRARALAEEARTYFAGLAERSPRVDEIDRWLAKHGARAGSAP